MNELFEAARRLNPVLPEQALRAAAAFVGEHLPRPQIHRADAVRCVELAGMFQGYESEDGVAVSGRSASTTDFLRQEYLLAIDPAVRQVRSHYFGQETVPFPDDQEAAAEWLNLSRERHGKELADLAHAVSQAAGFSMRAVIVYVLCGDEPFHQGISAKAHELTAQFGDASVKGIEVTLTLRSPDFSHADYQWVRAFVRRAWTLRDGAPPLRFEEEDEILRRLLIELGDDGNRRRRGFWPDLLTRWKEEVEDADATVPQLKMREQRLQRKLRQLKRETTP